MAADQTPHATSAALSPGGQTDGPDREARTVVYQELCKSHQAIADFRAKLLALLPAAAAAAVFLLVRKAGGDETDPQLLAIGLFGLVVTFGLFMYELRGIQDCRLLRTRAEQLEQRLRIPPAESQFHREPARSDQRRIVPAANSHQSSAP